ncbi:DUF4013 domain-containing protein [Haloferax sp. MBLA0076]|uniref:DUF4013 domain-containing protein n=1 Tax=Haloferax litoreum TaxID=2666140 RepID=A0A6A8GBZ7_9EURY|nr:MULTISPECIES: DUF4013 domain-containing protein [Haloferax]KAB1192266.1 DUF4013 domain-containing protein [Haloferax sp. CBA1148]MRX20723.1 DUF4013 domain-containing protein [Haloferax litoreum]
MDLSDLETAVALPFAADTSFDSVAIGVLVTLASFTTPLAGVLLAGYVARLVRAGSRDEATLSTFDGVLGMGVEGIRLSVVLVVLQLPAIAIAGAVLGSSSTPLTVFAAVADPRTLQYLGFSAFDVAGLVVAGLAALAGTYIGAAATVALAREQSLVAAVPVTRALVGDRAFFSVVSASALVVFGGRLLGFLVGTVPLVGVVLTAGVSFVTLVAAATLLGRGTNVVSKRALRPTHEPERDAVGSA